MHLKFYPLLLFLLFTQSLFAQVVINEYSAANMDGISDNYGEREDWVELYNTGSSNADISGYWLSDRLNNPDKWEFPAGTILGPGEHLLIYCSDRDEVSGGFYHAGFKLTQTKQEYIVFSDPSQNLVDAIQIVAANQVNHSSGRVQDGDVSWGIFQNPTPGAPNSNASQGYDAKPVFSQEAGFYNGSVSLSISASAGAEIRYTLDGSEPTQSSTLYSNPFTITETTVVKAKAYGDDASFLPSFVEANTYFIDEEHTIPVLSIAGDDLADLLAGSQFDPRGSFEYFEDEQLIDEAYGEFNKHGNDSWAYPQRGIDYITRDQMGYTSSISHQIFPTKDRDNFQRLIIKAAANDNYPFSNGGAHIRDAYVHTLSDLGGFELDERTSRPCIVYLNGEYWGVYDMREKVDDPDFTRAYYDQGEKWLDYIKTWGGTWEEYGSRDDWDDLHDFITANDMSVQANYEQAAEELNMLSLIDYMIINTHVVCMDWLNWNTSWWRGRKPEGEAKKWRYALWDMDATFGHYINYTGIPNTEPNADPCYAEDLPADFEGHGELISALLENEEFHSLYVNRYADMNNSFFTCDYMFGLLDSMIAEIEPEMQQQIDRWGGTMPEWQSNVQELRDFIDSRCVEINGGIVDCYEVEGPFPVTVNIEPPNEPNNVRVNTFIPAEYPFMGDYFVGTTLGFTAVPDPDWELDHWEVDNNTFTPGQFATAIQLSLTDTLGDVVTAVFRPAIPCAPAVNYEFDTTLSSIIIAWDGPSNIISYELGYRKTGSGEDYSTFTLTDPGYSIFGLDICTEYDIRIRTICDFAVGAYDEFVIKTNCLTDTEEAQAGIFEWNAYPNPFQNDLTLDLILAEQTDVTLQVLNLAGQVLVHQPCGQMQTGQHRLPIETGSDWADGVYLIRVMTNEGTVVSRVMKQ